MFESAASSPYMSSGTVVISVASALAAFVATYYSLFVIQKPKLFASSSKLRQFLQAHVPTLQTSFYPSPLFTEGRLQTIFSLSQRITSPSKLPYDRELFRLSDGGEVALDSMLLPDSKFLVLLLPGLTSSSQTSYVRTLVQSLNRAGASVVVFNNRGNGGVPFRTPKTYSASYIGDLIEVVRHLKEKFPEHRMVGLGTSLGGMVLAKYLVTRPEEAKGNLEAAILISIAWDATKGSENLEKPYVNKYLINKALTMGLIRLGKKFMAKFDTESLPFNAQQALKAKTVREFDVAVTAPQFGFQDVLDYYSDATTNGHIHKFSIPVFALSAEDDPIQPGHLLPTEEASAPNSKLALMVTTYGGHLGWIEGVQKNSSHYMERLIGELVQALRLHGKEELAGV